MRVADSVRVRADTLGPAADTLPADTIKAPLPRFPAPPDAGAGRAFRWNREEIGRTGAFTLDELLARVPGAEAFRTGWLAAPALVAYRGDVGRLRVFLDGVELEGLAPGTDGLLDLSRVQLWTLEEVSVERGADELRVYLTTWRVERTTSSTRTDIATGDQETNLYRGMFGRRFGRGEVLQLGGQQYGYSNSLDAFGGGDELSLFARAGIARRVWALDAYVQRGNRTRDAQPPLFGGPTLPRQEAIRTDGYARLALGNTDGGGWLHLIGAIQRFDQEATGSGVDALPDTLVSSRQYVATTGFVRGGFHISATGRMHDPRIGEERTAVTGRLSVDRRYFTVALRADARESDTISVEEASAALRPTSWLTVAGAVARRHGGEPELTQTSARAEIGLRLGGTWLIGGILTSDTTHAVTPPRLFDSALPAVEDADAPEATFAAIRGRVWRDVFVDAQVTQWAEDGWLRPKRSGYGYLYIDTQWLSRFPSGSFGFLGSAGYVFRDQVLFPTATGAADLGTAVRELRLHAEVRILDGAIFWKQYFRLDPARPEVVPGFGLVRQTSMYGVRWQFWN